MPMRDEKNMRPFFPTGLYWLGEYTIKLFKDLIHFIGKKCYELKFNIRTKDLNSVFGFSSNISFSFSFVSFFGYYLFTLQADSDSQVVRTLRENCR